MNDVIPFAYGDHPVRTIMIDDEPWFVLNDLARVLGLTRSASQIKERLDGGVRQTYPLPTPGGVQHTTIVSEPLSGRERSMTILEASTAANAAQDEVAKAESSLLMAVEFAQYALEDYADRPDIAALLDALTDYRGAQTAREAAGVALIDALEKELDR